MAPRHYKAFTLVEMLVVIVIISMLVALLLPAIAGARARARQASCLNNQGQVAEAILQYESAKGSLPGYINQTGKMGTSRLGLKRADSLTNISNVSWVVMILDELGHADTARQWKTKAEAPTPVAISEVVCPADTEKRGKGGALSYAVNCGISDYASDVSEYLAKVPSTTIQAPAWGLFFNHDDYSRPANVQRVDIAIDGIRDGAQQTMLLSENLHTGILPQGTWFFEKVNPSLTTPPSVPIVQQYNVGIVWWSTIAAFGWNSYVPETVTVNSTIPPGLFATNPGLFARPSSYHPGGVNAVYADGHGDFVSDRIDYEVYRDQLITDQGYAKGKLIP